MGPLHSRDCGRAAPSIKVLRNTTLLSGSSTETIHRQQSRKKSHVSNEDPQLLPPVGVGSKSAPLASMETRSCKLSM